MPKIKTLKSAHEDLKESLNAWFRSKERFEDENSWADGRSSPNYIVDEIGEAAGGIHSCIRIVSHILDRKSWRVVDKADADRSLVLIQMEQAVLYIHHASIEMRKSVEDGTEAMLEHCESPDVFLSWQRVCGAVESFALSAAHELSDLGSKYQDESDRGLFYAAGGLEMAANVALRCRKRGIQRYLNGRFSKYAWGDAKSMGLTIRDIQDFED
jgi:hypothetical protein